MAVSEEYLIYAVDQLTGLGPVTSRRMFGGAGLYSDGLMFAIIDDNTLYFKAANPYVADTYGLDLVCYEAGQHMVSSSGGENNEALTKLLHQANAHPRLGDIYDDYYEAW